MTEATDKLAHSRLAIVEYIARRERRHDPHEEKAASAGPYPAGKAAPAEGWLEHAVRAVQSWWQYHPAHLAVELATPALESYAMRRPGRLLAIAAVTGAAFMLARPWRLISLTTVLVAVLKSSQLSGLLMSALSAADYRKDNDQP